MNFHFHAGQFHNLRTQFITSAAAGFIIGLCLSLLGGCSPGQQIGNSDVTQEFRDYWYTGEADVVSYSLKQSRYGEIRQGHAVLIFVTEPFSLSHHIKVDKPKGSADEVTVMKMNYIKKFVTGIYPYSLMVSTFTPVNVDNQPAPLKISMTGQEWCGQVFTQLNLKKRAYVAQQFSYFESEGDKQTQISARVTEDGIWTLIRLNPDLLPTGKFEMIPGIYDIRLRHQALEPVEATANLKAVSNAMEYSVEFVNGRKFLWRFQKEFPHQIMRWEETFTDEKGKAHTTSATLKKVLHLPYWKFNGKGDTYLRDSLQLNSSS